MIFGYIVKACGLLISTFDDRKVKKKSTSSDDAKKNTFLVKLWAESNTIVKRKQNKATTQYDSIKWVIIVPEPSTDLYL